MTQASRAIGRVYSRDLVKGERSIALARLRRFMTF